MVRGSTDILSWLNLTFGQGSPCLAGGGRKAFPPSSSLAGGGVERPFPLPQAGGGGKGLSPSLAKLGEGRTVLQEASLACQEPPLKGPDRLG